MHILARIISIYGFDDFAILLDWNYVSGLEYINAVRNVSRLAVAQQNQFFAIY